MPRIAQPVEDVLERRRRFRLILDSAYSPHHKFSESALAFGMPVGTVWKYYREGPSCYTGAALNRISKLLGVTGAWLLGEVLPNADEERTLCLRLRRERIERGLRAFYEDVGISGDRWPSLSGLVDELLQEELQWTSESH